MIALLIIDVIILMVRMFTFILIEVVTLLVQKIFLKWLVVNLYFFNYWTDAFFSLNESNILTIIINNINLLS